MSSEFNCEFTCSYSERWGVNDLGFMPFDAPLHKDQEYIGLWFRIEILTVFEILGHCLFKGDGTT